MKLLITGGAGYIGSHTILDLIENGYSEIVSVDNYLNSTSDTYDRINKITGNSIKNYAIDLSNSTECEELFEKEKFDVVIHFAALKSVPESVDQPNLYYQNNLNSLINLLDNMKKQGCNQMIFSSSCSVYGNPEVLPVTEKTPMGIAESPYAHTKQIGEYIIENFSKANPNFKAYLLRYFNPAGAHKSGYIGETVTKRPNNFVPIIAQQAIGLRDQFEVFGGDYGTKDGSCIRDYVHVSDIAHAHVLAMENIKMTTESVKILNLGSGNGSTTLEVIHAFERVNNIKLNYKISGRRAGDVESIYADNEKAKAELKWDIQHNLDSIVETAWKWQQNADA